MKKFFMAVIALMMTISASAQFYIYFGDGNVIKVDSISMVAPESTAGIGVFSVSADKQVTFSPGNLQYHRMNKEWRFAENQTDCIGEDNIYDGWLDLFGWSTTVTNFGVSTSKDGADYYGSFVDWGTNKIGTDARRTWRTLTEDEWLYLLDSRPSASTLQGIAQVNGVNGLILLPDDWTCPTGITFTSGLSDGSVEAYGQYQTFSADQWSKLESAGAVFLPAAGYRHRYDSNVSGVQDRGYYWSATEDHGDLAICFFFHSNEVYMSNDDLNNGLSVRLVKDLQ